MLLALSAQAESLLKPKGKADALLPVDQAFAFVGASQSGGAVSLSWNIAPGYYLYAHSLKVTVDAPTGAPVPTAVLPQGQQLDDAEFGKVTVYRDALAVPLKLATGATPRTLRVRYQGCADIGVCYPPQTRLVALK